MGNMVVTPVDISQIVRSKLVNLNYSIDDDFAVFTYVSWFPPEKPIKMRMNFILVCMKGKCKINVNGKDYNFKEGECFFTMTGNILFSWSCTPDVVCHVICISDRLVRSCLNSDLEVWNRAFYINDLHILPIDSWFHSYLDFFMGKLAEPERPRKKQIILSLIQSVLLEFCDSITIEPINSIESDSTQGNLLFQKFLDLLEKTEPKRQTVEYYSDKLCISPKYLSMVCKMTSQKTASEWIRSYVDADVRSFLHRMDLSIKQVANMLGFENISFFGKYVRSRFGCSPREYRRRIKEGDKLSD
ncbi:MAG: helix-turn-helix domain-containing protein [Paludibacteraceae bacterium]|nr:helix-turn-helix domain-containing protein [Paludibacteraceae bacterium]